MFRLITHPIAVKDDDSISGCQVQTQSTSFCAQQEDKHLEKIFDPFFTTKSVNKGTGLGLSTVLGVIDAHDGDITVESVIEKGTRFELYLPLDDESPTTVPRTHPSQSVSTNGTEHIMIIDDSIQVAEMLKNGLELFDYRVSIFESGEKALEAFFKSPENYQLIISDITMPDITGIELAKELHKDFPDFPVVLMTGFDDSVQTATYRSQGIKQVLHKPVSLQQLTEVVRSTLDSA